MNDKEKMIKDLKMKYDELVEKMVWWKSDSVDENWCLGIEWWRNWTIIERKWGITNSESFFTSRNCKEKKQFLLRFLFLRMNEMNKWNKRMLLSKQQISKLGRRKKKLKIYDQKWLVEWINSLLIDPSSFSDITRRTSFEKSKFINIFTFIHGWKGSSNSSVILIECHGFFRMRKSNVWNKVRHLLNHHHDQQPFVVRVSIIH